jgi:hypothetical protein
MSKKKFLRCFESCLKPILKLNIVFTKYLSSLNLLAHIKENILKLNIVFTKYLSSLNLLAKEKKKVNKAERAKNKTKQIKMTSKSIRSTRSSIFDAFRLNKNQDISLRFKETPIPQRESVAVAIIHLPASLITPETLSPRLWSWIHGSDFRAPPHIGDDESPLRIIESDYRHPSYIMAGGGGIVKLQQGHENALRRAAKDSKLFNVRADMLIVPEHLYNMASANLSSSNLSSRTLVHDHDDAQYGLPKNLKSRYV